MNYDLVAFWSQIAGFVLFAAFTVWAWRQWLTPGIEAAQKASNERIALTERHRDEMNQSVKALEHEIEGAKRDAEKMKERVRERAAREHEAIVQAAKDEGERTLRHSAGELERARAAARAGLREELANKALEMAYGQSAARVDASVNDRLVQDFLSSLERGLNN